MSTDDEETALPNSMRHKQILEVAAENPDATMDELASMVPSATTELVERVLEEHGDPASDENPAHDTDSGEDSESTASNGKTETTTANATSSEDSSETTEGTVSETVELDETEPPDPDTLSAKQQEVLDAIASRPTATQREIGDMLDVSGPTVYNRVNSIPGFEWQNRDSFVEAVLNNEEDDTMSEDTQPQTDTAEQLAEVENRLSTLETTIKETPSPDSQSRETESALEDPEFVHKVLQACLDSEYLDEEDERRLIEEILV